MLKCISIQDHLICYCEAGTAEAFCQFKVFRLGNILVERTVLDALRKYLQMLCLKSSCFTASYCNVTFLSALITLHLHKSVTSSKDDGELSYRQITQTSELVFPWFKPRRTVLVF